MQEWLDSELQCEACGLNLPGTRRSLRAKLAGYSGRQLGHGLDTPAGSGGCARWAALFIGVASVASGGNRHSLNTRRRLSTWQAGEGQETRAPRSGRDREVKADRVLFVGERRL